jgi:hypothetical protein
MRSSTSKSLGSSCVSKRQQLEELLIAALSRKAAASKMWMPLVAVSYKYFRAEAGNSSLPLISSYL